MSRPQKHRMKHGGGAFTPLPRVCLQSKSFARLTPHALKLLFDLMAQYNGFNNGDLSAAWRLMQPRGWKSRDTLGKALHELLEGSWLIKTRQGGLHKCSLFASTLYAIDDCRDKKGQSKFDAHVKPTQTPLGGWFNESVAAGELVKRGKNISRADGNYKGTRQACQSMAD